MAEEAHHVSIRVEQPERPNMDSANPNNTELSTQNMGENKDEELFRRLDKAAQGQNKSGNNECGNGEETKDKIHGFLNMMREKYGSQYFEPKKIAIGPIHAKFEERKEGFDTPKSEELKHMWAAKYLDGLNRKEILKKIRDEIENKELQEKFFREEGVSTDGDDLARMLLVDGCAVLQFIYSFVWGDTSEDLNIKEDEASVVQQDLFLLENQIPFRVLEIIINEGPKNEQTAKPGQLKPKDERRAQGGTTKKGGASWNIVWARGGYKKVKKMEETLKLFIRMSNVALAPILLPHQSDPLKIDASVHLLDLLRRALVGDGYTSSANSCEQNWWLMPWKLILFIFRIPTLIWLICRLLLVLFLVIFGWVLYALFEIITKFDLSAGIGALDDFIYLLEFFIEIIILDPSKNNPISRCSFCFVQDVKQAGIKLKPTQSRCLSDVGFSSGFLSVNGCLKLLPMLLDESTPYKLLNLVAYEMCSSTTTDGRSYAVTSYLSFLESLIEDAQDVKDLRAAHILTYRLRNDVDRPGKYSGDCLKNDNDVVGLIRKINPSLVPEDVFSHDRAELREYCRKRRAVWASTFRQMYLSNPWTFIALIGALTGLTLTGISTYFAAFPNK